MFQFPRVRNWNTRHQSTTRVKPFICTMPMRLDEGWNQIQFNLSDFTRRAYGKRRFFFLPEFEWFHLFAPIATRTIITFCMKFNNLLLIFQALITSKLYGCKYMLTAASGAFISQIACIQRKSFLQSSNFSFQSRSSPEHFSFLYSVPYTVIPGPGESKKTALKQQKLRMS